MKSIGKKIADAIMEDCLDRQDLRQILENIDEDVRVEILKAWAKIVNDAIGKIAD